MLGEILMDLCRLAALREISAEEVLGQATERVIREAEKREKIENPVQIPLQNGQ